MATANKKKHQRKEYEAFETLKLVLARYDLASVADCSGITQQTLYNWLNGTVQSPQLRTLVAVAEVVGYTIALHQTRHAPAASRRQRLRLV